MPKAEEKAAKLHYEQRGFAVLAGAVNADLPKRMAALVANARDKEFVDGDNTSHAWREVNVVPPLSMSQIIERIDLPLIIGAEPISSVQWLNVYQRGQFISSHLDAGGDVQLLVPIELPPTGEGGGFWLGHKDRLLPLSIGDVVIFKAHRLQHGTSNVLRGRRVSLNVRLWL